MEVNANELLAFYQAMKIAIFTQKFYQTRFPHKNVGIIEIQTHRELIWSYITKFHSMSKCNEMKN